MKLSGTVIPTLSRELCRENCAPAARDIVTRAVEDTTPASGGLVLVTPA
jgi:hypothetical protein